MYLMLNRGSETRRVNSLNSLAICLVLGIATLLPAACANQMEPAKQALEEIYDIVLAATADGTKYVPDQMASVQKELGELQSSYDKKDYAVVLAHAPAVRADAKSLASAAADKKGEIAKERGTEWSGFAASLPQWITTVRDRLEVLSKPMRAPKGIDLATAKSEFADATDGWTRAQAAVTSGEIDIAVASAKDAKLKIEAAADALKLELPGINK
jgi:hypothetical protein